MPGVVLASTTNVAVELPAPEIDVGLKLTDTPAGAPVADSAMAELKPLVIVVLIVDEPLLPAVTETEVGKALIAKSLVVCDEPVSAAIRPAFGLPQPVTRS